MIFIIFAIIKPINNVIPKFIIYPKINADNNPRKTSNAVKAIFLIYLVPEFFHLEKT